MIFKQTAKLTTNYKGEVEENFYEYTFAVKVKGNTEKTSFIYDKELKMHFENPSGVVYSYEVEITNVKLNLCRRLKKSTNFNRKLFYRYDFIKPKVNNRGQVISIQNKPQLKRTWEKLKAKMLIDHQGDYPQKYLDKVDTEFTTDESVYPVMSQYLKFGLLYFNIPKSHSSNWTGKRLVEFSPYEREKFEETIVISSISDKEITYKIEGKAQENSNTHIRKYAGYAIKGVDENFVRKIELSTSIIKDSITSEWEFIFYKI